MIYYNLETMPYWWEMAHGEICGQSKLVFEDLRWYRG